MEEAPKQHSGFVNFGRCDVCNWPHHDRVVRRKGFRKKNRIKIFLNKCLNCYHETEIWRGSY